MSQPTTATAAPQTPRPAAPQNAAPSGQQSDEAKAKAAADAAAKAEADELDFLAAPVILSPELVRESAPQNARNPRQVKMDETVKRLHDAWSKANGPSTWGAAVNAKVVATYFVEPEKAADVKKLVTKAGRFHHVTIRWGTSFKATEEIVKRHALPANYVGREVLSFFVKTTRTVAKNGQGGNRRNGPVTTTQTAPATAAKSDAK